MNMVLKKRLRWKGKFISEIVLNQRIAQTQSGKKRQVEVHENDENEPLNLQTPMEGRRIVDIAHLVKNLKCKHCNGSLLLENIESEKRIGLASIFSVRCQKCLLIVKVPTSKSAHDIDKRCKLYDNNSRAVVGSVEADMDSSQLNKVLACLNIPQLQEHLYKKHERITESAMETVAKKSLDAALLEKSLTLSNLDTLQEIL